MSLLHHDVPMMDDGDLLVVYLSIGAMPQDVLVPLLDHGDRNDQEEGYNGDPGRYRAVDRELNNAHDQEIEVGYASKLLEQIPAREKVFLYRFAKQGFSVLSVVAGQPVAYGDERA